MNRSLYKCCTNSACKLPDKWAGGWDPPSCVFPFLIFGYGVSVIPLPIEQREPFQIYLKWEVTDYMTHMSLLKLIFFMFINVSYFCGIGIVTMWNKGLSLQPLGV